MNDLALIVLNYNSASNTIFCVNQLLDLGEDYRIIVVDNKSTDNSQITLKTMFAEDSRVDFICAEHNGGYSAGNNFGIRYAINKYAVRYIAILNPDVIVPERRVFERMMAVIKSYEKIGVVGASMINAEGEYNPSYSGWSIPSSKELVTDHCLFRRHKAKSQTLKMIGYSVAQVDCVVGCFFMADVKILQEVGFLDENVFLYNEENILGIKLKRAGYVEAVVLDQFYIHNHDYKQENNENISFKKKISTTKNGYVSRKYLCKTYYSRILLPLLWFVEMLNRLYLIMCYLKGFIKK